MASPDEHNLTFLRGSGFLLSLVGVWDLMADESSQWPSQKGFLIFKETKIIAVIERNEDMRRGVEGTYSVEGNRIIITGLLIDTAPERGAPGDGEFKIEFQANMNDTQRNGGSQARTQPPKFFSGCSCQTAPVGGREKKG